MMPTAASLRQPRPPRQRHRHLPSPVHSRSGLRNAAGVEHGPMRIFVSASASRRRPCLFRQDDVHRVRAADTLGAFEAQCRQVDAGEQGLARSEQGRRERQVHLVHQTGTQELSDGRDATAQANVLTPGRLLRKGEGFVMPTPRGFSTLCRGPAP